MCKQDTHKRVDYKRMNRSIRDMSNLCDDITSPSHTHVMFDKMNVFFLFFRYGHRRVLVRGYTCGHSKSSFFLLSMYVIITEVPLVI